MAIDSKIPASLRLLFGGKEAIILGKSWKKKEKRNDSHQIFIRISLEKERFLKIFNVSPFLRAPGGKDLGVSSEPAELSREAVEPSFSKSLASFCVKEKVKE